MAIFGRSTHHDMTQRERFVVVRFLRHEPLWRLFRSLWNARRWSAATWAEIEAREQRDEENRQRLRMDSRVLVAGPVDERRMADEVRRASRRGLLA